VVNASTADEKGVAGADLILFAIDPPGEETFEAVYDLVYVFMVVRDRNPGV
jgi:hypothetical protein